MLPEHAELAAKFIAGEITGLARRVAPGWAAQCTEQELAAIARRVVELNPSLAVEWLAPIRRSATSNTYEGRITRDGRAASRRRFQMTHQEISWTFGS